MSINGLSDPECPVVVSEGTALVIKEKNFQENGLKGESTELNKNVNEEDEEAKNGSESNHQFSDTDSDIDNIDNEDMILPANNEMDIQDEDKLFCLLMYSEFKKIPQHRRLATKIEIVELIQEALNFHGPNTAPILPWSPSSSSPDYSDDGDLLE